MKRCNYCGREIDDYAIFCKHCGANQSERNYRSYNEGEDQHSAQNAGNGYGVNGYRSMGFAVLAFFFPVVGLILCYVWRHSRPGRAMSLLKGAIASVAIGSPIIGLAAWFLTRGNYRFRELSSHILKCSLIGVAISVLSYIAMLLIYMYAPDFYGELQRMYFDFYF